MKKTTFLKYRNWFSCRDKAYFLPAKYLMLLIFLLSSILSTGQVIESPLSGSTLARPDQLIIAQKNTAAVKYVFTVTAAGFSADYESTTRSFRLTDLGSQVSNLLFDSTFNVRVNAYDANNNDLFPGENTTYIFYTSSSPRLVPLHCGSTLQTFGDYITSTTSNNAVSYKFKITGVSGTFEYESPVRQFRLTDVPGLNLANSTAYSISVAAKYNNFYSSYGPVCNINTPAPVYTQLITAHCGSTLSQFDAYLTANSISTATSYKFKITGGGINTEYVSPSRQFKLTDIPNVNISAATTFQVSVAVGQGEQYHPFGPICNITTPAPLYTQLITSHCNSTLSQFNAYLTANSIPTATSYKFRITGGGINTEYVSPSRQFKLTDITNVAFSAGTTYQVSVAVGQGGQYYPYGPVCNITTPAPVYTQLITAHCGSTLLKYDAYITANSISTATSYKFKITGGNINTEYVSNSRQFKLTDVPGVNISAETTYQVSVAVGQEGQYHPYGPICNITTPSALYTQIQGSQCGTIINNLNVNIIAEPVSGVSEYKFRIVGGNVNIEVAQSGNQLDLSSVAGIEAGISYSISVAIKLGIISNPYGPNCLITYVAPVTTQLISSQCGSTLTGTSVNAIAVASASEYKFKIVGDNFNTEIIQAGSQLNLNTVTGIVRGMPYSISIALKTNGVWNPYGSVCNVTIKSVTTQLVTEQCNATVVGNYANASYVSGASEYKFRVVADNIDTEIIQTSRQLNLNNLTELGPGAYTISVATKVGGLWNPYGPTCVFTRVPTILYLDPSICGQSRDATVNLYVHGASNSWITGTSYRFKVIGNGQESVIETPANIPYLNPMQIPGLQVGVPYSISVGTKVNDIWHPYDSECTVTFTSTNVTQLLPSQCGSTLTGTSINAVPVSSASQYKFKIVGSNINTEITQSGNQLDLSLVAGVEAGIPYSISVAIKLGSSWYPYGPSCVVIFDAPASGARMAVCEKHISSLSEPISFEELSKADMYEFVITSGDEYYTYYSKLPELHLTDVDGFKPEYNSDYQVATSFYQAGQWSEASVCRVLTPDFVNANMESQTLSDFDVKTYPNPFTSECNLDILSTDSGPVEIYVYDALGRMVEQQQLFDKRQTVLGILLPPAVYNVVVKQGNNQKNILLIKK